MLHAPEHTALLQRIAETHPDPSLQQRARLLLLYHEGHPTNAVADAVELSPSTTRRWRRRYLDEGLAAVFPPDALVETAPGADGAGEEETASDETPPEETLQARIDVLFDEVSTALRGKKRKALRAYRKQKPKKALKKLGATLLKRRKRLRKRLKTDKLSGKKRKKLKKQRKALKRYLRRTQALLDELS